MSTYNDRSCDPLEEGSYTGDEIPYIDQKTIECNLTRFADWLNRLVDQVNYLSCLYLDLKEVVLENRHRIECLESRVDELERTVANHETRIGNLETRMGTAETNINNLTTALGDVINNVATATSRINKLYSYLPVSTDILDQRAWKFGMGNINVMSANNGTPAITGPGIFTSNSIENNDLYFN
jgi:uncharacterized coiled-coil protein SlyX